MCEYSERVREVVLMALRYLKDEVLVALAQRPGLDTAPGWLGPGPGLAPGLHQRQGLGQGPASKKGPGQATAQGQGLGPGQELGPRSGPFMMSPSPPPPLSLSSLLQCMGGLLQQLQAVMDMVEEDAGAWYRQQVRGKREKY